jgi:F0F1-type ATP synthase membrane subunit b/b'
MRAAQRERDRVLEEARHAAHETVRAARERLDAEATEARDALDTRADALATEILRVILPSATGIASPTPLPRSAY